MCVERSYKGEAPRGRIFFEGLRIECPLSLVSLTCLKNAPSFRKWKINLNWKAFQINLPEKKKIAAIISRSNHKYLDYCCISSFYALSRISFSLSYFHARRLQSSCSAATPPVPSKSRETRGAEAGAGPLPAAQCGRILLWPVFSAL